MIQWIDPKTALPKIDEPVLVACKLADGSWEFWVAEMWGDDGRFYNDEARCLDVVAWATINVPDCSWLPPYRDGADAMKRRNFLAGLLAALPAGLLPWRKAKATAIRVSGALPPEKALDLCIMEMLRVQVKSYDQSPRNVAQLIGTLNAETVQIGSVIFPPGYLRFDSWQHRVFEPDETFGMISFRQMRRPIEEFPTPEGPRCFALHGRTNFWTDLGLYVEPETIAAIEKATKPPYPDPRPPVIGEQEIIVGDLPCA